MVQFYVDAYYAKTDDLRMSWVDDYCLNTMHTNTSGSVLEARKILFTSVHCEHTNELRWQHDITTPLRYTCRGELYIAELI